MRAVKIPRLMGGGLGWRRETCVYWGGLKGMVPCYHQGNIYIKRKQRVWRVRKSIFPVGAKTPLTCTGRQSNPSEPRRYRVEKGNLRSLGWTYCHGTVFAPRRYLNEKEATGMESREMHFPSPCKNPTYLCRSSKYPVSREAVEGREGKLAYIGVDLPPWYRVCTKAIYISKGSQGYGESGNAFS